VAPEYFYYAKDEVSEDWSIEACIKSADSMGKSCGGNGSDFTGNW
jgi:hypothetical protein